MGRKSKVKYDPKLSIAEIAKRSGVTEAAVWYYIKVNGIDRRYDRKANKIAVCRDYLKKHPTATKAEVHRATGYNHLTISKYWDNIAHEEELIFFNSKRTKKRQLRQPNNFYATHPSVARDIISVESFNNKILEPFCGSGMMAEVFKTNGYDVVAYDLIDRGYGKVGDFFKVDYPEQEYDIITNPPYDSTLISIVKRCYKLCRNKVALLLPLSYLSGNERAEQLYGSLPPKTVYVYSNRIQIGKDGVFDNSLGNKIPYAWYVWERGYQGDTHLKQIKNRPDANPVVKEMPKSSAKRLGIRIKNVIRIHDGRIETYYREKEPAKPDYQKILSEIPPEEIDKFLAARATKNNRTIKTNGELNYVEEKQVENK